MNIHDHFNGSAHCIECDGVCKLKGDEATVTKLMRYSFEFACNVHDGWMWDLVKDSLKELLGPVKYREFERRAKETKYKR